MKILRRMLSVAALLWLAACMAPPELAPATPIPAGQIPLDSGDQLRIVVLGQDDLTGTYTVDEGGSISMPLIGRVTARGRTTASLEAAIAAALREGFLRSPDVTVRVEAFRPIFVLGEVTNPGQYAYTVGLTVQQAIATAGGFTPRGSQTTFDVVRRSGRSVTPLRLGLLDWVAPGDTITVRQRLF
jgi:polysaccharide biosynthesis/export protein